MPPPMVPSPMKPTFMRFPLPVRCQRTLRCGSRATRRRSNQLALGLLALADVFLFLDHRAVLPDRVGDRRPARVMPDLDDDFDDLLARDAEVLGAAIVRM